MEDAQHQPPVGPAHGDPRRDRRGHRRDGARERRRDDDPPVSRRDPHPRRLAHPLPLQRAAAEGAGRRARVGQGVQPQRRRAGGRRRWRDERSRRRVGPGADPVPVAPRRTAPFLGRLREHRGGRGRDRRVGHAVGNRRHRSRRRDRNADRWRRGVAARGVRRAIHPTAHPRPRGRRSVADDARP